MDVSMGYLCISPWYTRSHDSYRVCTDRAHFAQSINQAHIIIIRPVEHPPCDPQIAPSISAGSPRMASHDAPAMYSPPCTPPHILLPLTSYGTGRPCDDTATIPLSSCGTAIAIHRCNLHPSGLNRPNEASRPCSSAFSKAPESSRNSGSWRLASFSKPPGVSVLSLCALDRQA